MIVNKVFDDLFDELVPDMGPAKSLGGEIVRATARIGYRWYNDGDKVYVGYGRETCNQAARFLRYNLPDNMNDLVAALAETNSDDEKYEEAVQNLVDGVADYIMSTPEIKKVPLMHEMFDEIYYDREEDTDNYEDEDDEYYDNYYEEGDE